MKQNRSYICQDLFQYVGYIIFHVLKFVLIIKASLDRSITHFLLQLIRSKLRKLNAVKNCKFGVQAFRLGIHQHGYCNSCQDIDTEESSSLGSSLPWKPFGYLHL